MPSSADDTDAQHDKVDRTESNDRPDTHAAGTGTPASRQPADSRAGEGAAGLVPPLSGAAAAGELQELPARWGWLLAVGAALVALGTFGLVFSVAFTIAGVITFAALALSAGILQLWHALTTREISWGGRGLHSLVALAYLLLGGLLLWNPVSGSLSLTLVLAAFLLVLGASRIAFAWRCRRQGWRWKFAAFAGAVDLVLAGLIVYGWPGTGFWVIGLFLAIDMLFTGSLLTALALTARSEQRGDDRSDGAHGGSGSRLAHGSA